MRPDLANQLRPGIVGWAAHAERLFHEIAAQEGARLPGEGRAARRARIAERGIEITEARLEKARLEQLRLDALMGVAPPKIG